MKSRVPYESAMAMSNTCSVLIKISKRNTYKLTIVKLLETCLSKISIMETCPAPSSLLGPSFSRRFVTSEVERPFLFLSQ